MVSIYIMIYFFSYGLGCKNITIVMPSTLVFFSLYLSSRYYSSSVSTQTASLDPVGMLLSVLPLYSLQGL